MIYLYIKNRKALQELPADCIVALDTLDIGPISGLDIEGFTLPGLALEAL